MKFFKKINLKDVGERAIKTFVEAFIATVAACGCFDVADGESLKSAVVTTAVAGIAAGVSAVWNMLGNIFRKGEEI